MTYASNTYFIFVPALPLYSFPYKTVIHLFTYILSTCYVSGVFLSARDAKCLHAADNSPGGRGYRERICLCWMWQLLWKKKAWPGVEWWRDQGRLPMEIGWPAHPSRDPNEVSQWGLWLFGVIAGKGNTSGFFKSQDTFRLKIEISAPKSGINIFWCWKLLGLGLIFVFIEAFDNIWLLLWYHNSFCQKGCDGLMLIS